MDTRTLKWLVCTFLLLITLPRPDQCLIPLPFSIQSAYCNTATISVKHYYRTLFPGVILQLQSTIICPFHTLLHCFCICTAFKLTSLEHQMHRSFAFALLRPPAPEEVGSCTLGVNEPVNGQFSEPNQFNPFFFAANCLYWSTIIKLVNVDPTNSTPTHWTV